MRTKTLLIVSFDVIREHDPSVPYSIATLCAYLKAAPEYGKSFDVERLSINLEYSTPTASEAADKIYSETDPNGCTWIALSCYAWCDTLVSELLPVFRARGFKGAFILGGYQVTATADNDLPAYYPDVRFFIKGYAEKSLLQIALGKADSGSSILKMPPDFNRLPSVFLSGEIPIGDGVRMIRWETKRGCPFKCGFCEWKNEVNARIYPFAMERLREELGLFAKHNIDKINVLDPTFNCGKNYLEILRLMVDSGRCFSMQARFETIKGKDGKQFLDLCSNNPNIHLEFGLQTVVPSEMEKIGRKNDVDHVRDVMQELAARNVSYEISLIYAIPGQTVETFLETLLFVKENGCRNIACYPLRIPRGTTLQCDADGDRVRHTKGCGKDVSTVKSSHSFDHEERKEMERIIDFVKSAAVSRNGNIVIWEPDSLRLKENHLSPDKLEHIQERASISVEGINEDASAITDMTAPELMRYWGKDAANRRGRYFNNGTWRNCVIKKKGMDFFVYL